MIIIVDEGKEINNFVKSYLDENNIKYSEEKSIDECFFRNQAEIFVDNLVSENVLKDINLKDNLVNMVTKKFLETGMYSDDEYNCSDAQEICKSILFK